MPYTSSSSSSSSPMPSPRMRNPFGQFHYDGVFNSSEQGQCFAQAGIRIRSPSHSSSSSSSAPVWRPRRRSSPESGEESSRSHLAPPHRLVASPRSAASATSEVSRRSCVTSRNGSPVPQRKNFAYDSPSSGPSQQTPISSPQPSRTSMSPKTPSFLASQCIAEITSLECHGGVSAHRGPLPTIAEAAKNRAERLKGAIHVEAAGLMLHVDHSDLCKEGQICVWRWARGQISGRQCLLHLEFTPTVAQLLEDGQGSAYDNGEQEAEAALWAVGCIRLGAADSRLGALWQDLEAKSPRVMLRDAWKEVWREWGQLEEEVESKDGAMEWPREVNRLLQRISSKVRRHVSSDVASYLRVQLWRELVRVHLGVDEDVMFAQDEENSADDERSRVVARAGKTADDTTILEFLGKCDKEVRQEARELPHWRLPHQADQLLDYAGQTMRFGVRLRKALAGLERCDAYRMLGVKRGAKLAEVRRAFFKKALLVHPDKGGDKAAFQELQNAYDEIVAELNSKKESTDAEDEQDEAEQTAESPRTNRKRRPPKSARKKKGGENDDSGTTDGRTAADAADENNDEGEKADDTGEEEEGDNDEDDEEEVQDGLEWLAAKASSAAESAGELASETLKHCRITREALEESILDWEKGNENAEVALAAAKAVHEAARVVSQLTCRSASELEAFASTRGDVGNGGGDNKEQKEEAEEDAEEEDENDEEAKKCVDGQPSSEWLANAVSAAREACQAITSTSSVFDSAFRMASSFLPAMQMQSEPSDSQTDNNQTAITAVRFCAALGAIAEATKMLAVAALDAAEAAADAASLWRRCTKQASEASAGDGNLKEGDGQDVDGDAQAEEKDEEESAEQAEKRRRDSIEARRLMESRKAISTLVQTLGMLRSTNRELLRLQDAARLLVLKEVGALPRVLAGVRDHAFALLAEYFDQAALAFHASLEGALAPEREVPPNSETWASRALIGSFGFLLRADVDLAVPIDLKGQALRAAIAIDAAAVSSMLREQVAQRLRGSLMGLMLDPRTWEFVGEGDLSDEMAAIVDIHVSDLTRAVARLEVKLQEPRVAT